jgi:ATP-dependent RNA helicase RhlE
MSFEQLELQDQLLQSILSVGFDNPTPVQAKVIPTIMEGKDVLALAETGSGKTAAFAIPLIQKALEQELKTLKLILSPTRELAQQTFTTFKSLGEELGVKCANVIGGESIQKQKDTLEDVVQVVVGTPGRVLDLAKQKVLDLSQVDTVVFDEADKLFDMGFKKEIEAILDKIPRQRQLILMSATSNQELLHTAYKFHSEPEEITLNEDALIVENIDHALAMLSREEKFPYLVNLLRKQEDAYAIIFCNTQFKTHEVSEWLVAMGFKASSISGKLPQKKRTQLMKDFRSKETTILVCTDVAARGLDIKNVNIVINYDLPNEAANYVHRIGRTGRAGEKGYAVSLCAYEDCDNLEAIYNLIEQKIPKLEVAEGDFADDICPKPYLDRKTLKVQENNKKRRPQKPTRSPKRDDGKGRPRQQKKEPTMQQQTFKPQLKTYTITSTSLIEAQDKALKHFGINDNKRIAYTVKEKGKKKFIFFGKQEVTYDFYINSPYQKMLKEFTEQLIAKMQMNLDFTIQENRSSLTLFFKGADIGLMLTNRRQLLSAVELVIKQHMQKKVRLPRNMRLQVMAIGDNPKPQEKNNEDFLIKLAEKLKKQVIESGSPTFTKTLNPAERRIIHQHLQDETQVETSSIGDGRFKKVKISPLAQ